MRRRQEAPATPTHTQFTGRENDGTGLYFNRARYYSPTLQRFIGQDPIGFAGGDANFYAFVGNDPINYLDLFGLSMDYPPFSLPPGHTWKQLPLAPGADRQKWVPSPRLPSRKASPSLIAAYTVRRASLR